MYEMLQATELLLFSAGHKNKETMHNRAAGEHVTPAAGSAGAQTQTHTAQMY